MPGPGFLSSELVPHVAGSRVAGKRWQTGPPLVLDLACRAGLWLQRPRRTHHAWAGRDHAPGGWVWAPAVRSSRTNMTSKLCLQPVMPVPALIGQSLANPYLSCVQLFFHWPTCMRSRYWCQPADPGRPVWHRRHRADLHRRPGERPALLAAWLAAWLRPAPGRHGRGHPPPVLHSPAGDMCAALLPLLGTLCSRLRCS